VSTSLGCNKKLLKLFTQIETLNTNREITVRMLEPLDDSCNGHDPLFGVYLIYRMIQQECAKFLAYINQNILNTKILLP
jgi:hypothetical protein